MKFYLAGASVQAQLCQQWIRNLQERGHTCTLDWTIPVLEAIAAGKSDKDMGEAERQQHSSRDLAGVANASVFWLLMPPKGSSWGSGVELGYALGLVKGSLRGAPWIIVSGDYPASIFTCQADRLFGTHAEAFGAICREFPAR